MDEDLLSLLKIDTTPSLESFSLDASSSFQMDEIFPSLESLVMSVPPNWKAAPSLFCETLSAKVEPRNPEKLKEVGKILRLGEPHSWYSIRARQQSAGADP